MTLRYAHFAPEALRQSISVLPELSKFGQQVGTLLAETMISPPFSSEPPTENLALDTQESRLAGAIQ